MALGEGGMFLWKVSLGKFPIRNYPGSLGQQLSINDDDGCIFDNPAAWSASDRCVLTHCPLIQDVPLLLLPTGAQC